MAKLPPLITCIIAEQVRPEPNNRSTVLGFVGISPIAEIMVSSFPTTIHLALMLLCEKVTAPGDFEIEVEVITSDQQTLLPRTRVIGQAEIVVGRRAFYVLNFQGLPIG